RSIAPSPRIGLFSQPVPCSSSPRAVNPCATRVPGGAASLPALQHLAPKPPDPHRPDHFALLTLHHPLRGYPHFAFRLPPALSPCQPRSSPTTVTRPPPRASNSPGRSPPVPAA